MISKRFALKLFEGFSIQRWNDRVRPIELTEMDKSAHKMTIAYFLGKLEEKNGETINWEKIIYGGFFELLKKIALSDIKAPVHRQIKKHYPGEFAKLNEWVVSQYELLIDDDLLAKFGEYLTIKEDLSDINFKILRAAHKYTTLREFEIIRQVNVAAPQLHRIEKELNEDLKDFLDLKGLQLLIMKQELYELSLYIEQLRFQVRWSQTPRIPRTSVLGHSLLVACFSLLFTRELKPEAAQRRIYNNFFCGLFHDLPEAVTRDIISPVKRSFESFASVVKNIEDEMVEDELFQIMDDSFKDEIRYFTQNEFANRVRINGLDQLVVYDQYQNYNDDRFSPVDGEIIKLADEMAAFLEAHQSISYGITSTQLKEGWSHIHTKYMQKKPIYGLDARIFFSQFEL